MYIPAFINRHRSKGFFLTVILFVVLTLIGIVRFYNPTAYANLVQNPGFESGTTSWQLNLRGTGAGNFSTTTSTKNGGAASAVVNISATSANVYDVEIANYGLPMTSGQTYTVSFWARASANRTIDVVVQQSVTPYTEYMRRSASLTTTWQQYTYTFVAPQTQTNVFVGLQFANATGTVNIDDVQYFQGTTGSPPGWWDTNWQNRKKITLNNTASTEALNNFPIRVSLTNTRIDYSKTQNAGQDIRFVDANGTTVLAHEIETWNESGTSEVWVNVPQIDANTNSDYIWMYYNNPSAPNGENVNGAWNSGYASVWHLDENPGVTLGGFEDSTATANHGSGGAGAAGNVPTQVTGKISNAQDFDGSTDLIYTPNTTLFNIASAYTLEAWINADTCGESNGGSIMEKSSMLSFYVCQSTNNIAVEYATATNTIFESTASSISMNNWYHVAAVYNGSGTGRMYVNGVDVSNDTAISGPTNANTPVIIGADKTGTTTYSFDGTIDEARVSNVARSTSWIQATYLTQNDGMNSFGAEETPSSGTATGNNLLKNSSCDTDTTSWQSWQGTLSRVSSPTRTGAGSCYVQHATGTAYTLDDIGSSTITNPVQGASYTGSVWVRTDTAVGKPVRLAIRAWNGGTQGPISWGNTVILSTSWQQVTNTMTVNASGYSGLDYYIAQENAAPGDSFYADDMQLYAGTAVPTLAPVPTGATTATFVKAINFNGSQLVVDGMTFDTEATAGVVVSGETRFQNQNITLTPSVGTSKAQMLRSSIFKGSNPQLNVGIPLANGSYNVFVYTWEDSSSVTYNLALEGNTVAVGLPSGAAGNWDRLGPYTVTVSDGSLSFAQTGGDFNLSGIEIHSVTASTAPANSVIVHRASSNAANGSGSSSLTLQKPSGVLLNDVMVAHVVAGGAGSTTITPPAGWNFIRRNNSTSDVASAIYYKVAGDSEPASYTWTLSPSTVAAGGIAAYYNVDVTDPIDAHSGQYNDNSPNMIAPSVTTVTTGERLLFISGIELGSGTVTAPTGMTPRWTTSGGQRLSYLADMAVPASGPTGNKTGLFSVSGFTNMSHLVALRPATITSEPIAPLPVALPGSITNLNFYMSNFNPWLQSVCGDIRIDSGVAIPVPASQSAIIQNASCATPGLVYSGDSSYSFGLGQASSTNQVVGGLSYPEVYEPPQKTGIFSSYTNVTQKAAANGLTVTDLPCTLANCTLPNNLAGGIYHANGNVVLNAVDLNPNRDYVFLINGNLTINGTLQTGIGTTTLYIASGDIILPPTVGNAPATTTSNMQGIFSADKSFIMNSTGACATERRLIIEGALIINAARTGGSLQNNRDLCGTNLSVPTLQVTQRLDYILNIPEFLRYQRIISNEVAP